MADPAVLSNFAASTDSDPLLTVKEVAELGFGHPQTIRRYIRDGLLAAEQIDMRGTYGIRKSSLGELHPPAGAQRTKDVLDFHFAWVVRRFALLSADQRNELAARLATV